MDFKKLDDYISTLSLSNENTNNRSYLIQVLHKAQTIYGYLPEDLQKHIARKLKLHHSEVYGVISFYSFFTTKKRGEFVFSVCLGTACYVRGAKEILETLERELGIKMGGTTDDGKFSLEPVRCIGACALAPVMVVNGKAYGHLTPAKVKQIIQDYSQQTSQTEGNL